jgi:cell division topological specificity factor
MSILDIFKSKHKNSANIAKDRLLQLIVDERMHSKISKVDLDELQKALIEVVARFLPTHQHQVSVEVVRDDSRATLEVNVVVLPEGGAVAAN